MASTLGVDTVDPAAVERNGRRRRQRATERVANAVEAVTRALEPLDAESRGRVLRAAAMLLDVHESP
jgi:acyl-CoA reductase-like NAD-dependent aldehyde dehydrogenase